MLSVLRIDYLTRIPYTKIEKEVTQKHVQNERFSFIFHKLERTAIFLRLKVTVDVSALICLKKTAAQ